MSNVLNIKFVNLKLAVAVGVVLATALMVVSFAVATTSQAQSETATLSIAPPLASAETSTAPVAPPAMPQMETISPMIVPPEGAVAMPPPPSAEAVPSPPLPPPPPPPPAQSADVIAPNLTANFATNDVAHPHHANSGDIITITLTANETLSATPTANLLIGSSTKSISFVRITGTNEYRATYTTSTSDNGTLSLINIHASDNAGNTTTTATGSHSSITADNIAPILTASFQKLRIPVNAESGETTAQVTGYSSTTYVSPGDGVTIAIESNEALAEVPTADLAIGGAFVRRLNLSHTYGYRYTDLYTMSTGSNGTFAINNVTAQDLAGNIASSPVSISRLVADSAPPIIYAEFNNSGTDSHNALPSEVVSITIFSNERLSSVPTANLRIGSSSRNITFRTPRPPTSPAPPGAESGGANSGSSSTNRYIATYTIRSGDSGILSLSNIVARDVAGKRSPVRTSVAEILVHPTTPQRAGTRNEYINALYSDFQFKRIVRESYIFTWTESVREIVGHRNVREIVGHRNVQVLTQYVVERQVFVRNDTVIRGTTFTSPRYRSRTTTNRRVVGTRLEWRPPERCAVHSGPTIESSPNDPANGGVSGEAEVSGSTSPHGCYVRVNIYETVRVNNCDVSDRNGKYKRYNNTTCYSLRREATTEPVYRTNTLTINKDDRQSGDRIIGRIYETQSVPIYDTVRHPIYETRDVHHSETRYRNVTRDATYHNATYAITPAPNRRYIYNWATHRSTINSTLNDFIAYDNEQMRSQHIFGHSFYNLNEYARRFFDPVTFWEAINKYVDEMDTFILPATITNVSAMATFEELKAEVLMLNSSIVLDMNGSDMMVLDSLIAIGRELGTCLVDAGWEFILSNDPGNTLANILMDNGHSCQSIDPHLILDILGLLPGVGAVFDLTNTVWYAIEGNFVDATLSGFAIIPAVGHVAATARIGGRVLKVGNISYDLSNAYELAKVFKNANPGSRYVDGLTAARQGLLPYAQKIVDAVKSKVPSRLDEAANHIGDALKNKNSLNSNQLNLIQHTVQRIEGAGKTIGLSQSKYTHPELVSALRGVEDQAQLERFASTIKEYASQSTTWLNDSDTLAHVRFGVRRNGGTTHEVVFYNETARKAFAVFDVSKISENGVHSDLVTSYRNSSMSHYKNNLRQTYQNISRNEAELNVEVFPVSS